MIQWSNDCQYRFRRTHFEHWRFAWENKNTFVFTFIAKKQKGNWRTFNVKLSVIWYSSKFLVSDHRLLVQNHYQSKFVSNHNIVPCCVFLAMSFPTGNRTKCSTGSIIKVSCMLETLMKRIKKQKGTMPPVRIELTAFSFLVVCLDYETDALPTELRRPISLYQCKNFSL